MLLEGKGAILSVMKVGQSTAILLFVMIQSEVFHNIRTQNFILNASVPK